MQPLYSLLRALYISRITVDNSITENTLQQQQTMEGLTSPVRRSVFLAPLTEEELNAVTVVFHQYETGLREGCIFTKVDTG